MPAAFLVVVKGCGILQASSGWRPGELVNTLQCTGWPHSKDVSGAKCQRGGETLVSFKKPSPPGVHHFTRDERHTEGMELSECKATCPQREMNDTALH